MPLIGLDARLLAYRRGMGNYVHGLLWSLSELAPDHEFLLYVDRHEAVDSVPPMWRKSVRVLEPRLYPIWEQVSLPIAAARDKVDLLHCPSNTAPAFLPAQIRLVVTIHDVMYFLPGTAVPLPVSSYQRLGRIYRRIFARLAARRASAIVTDSFATERDLSNYLRVESHRVHVVHLAAGSAFRPVARDEARSRLESAFGLRRYYFLCLAGADPRKNTRRVLEAFQEVRSTTGDSLGLVLVGNQDEQSAGLPEAPGRISGDVLRLPYVAQNDLVDLYGCAEALVYPSLYEGFGLPVLEAMACGTPVISSDRGSLAEITGDAALIVDPESVPSIAAAMLQVLTDPVLRAGLVQRGSDQASSFSWSRVAEDMVCIYEKACT